MTSHGCVTIAIVALLAVAPHVALAKPAKRAAHPAAKKASPAPPAAKERAPSGSAASSETSRASTSSSTSNDGDSDSSQSGGEGAATTTSAPSGGKVKSKTYTFGAMDVEGKLKTPQLLYFLNRVRLELDMSAPDKRSFMKELQQSADDKNL